MNRSKKPAPIIILNGAPRSGKSSIVVAIQSLDERPWMNLGVDTYVLAVTPERFRPGIGLRPGGERPDIEALLPTFYLALYTSIAAHSRLGLPVVAEFGHHEGHSKPLGILRRAARVLAGLPVLFVGVQCPLDVIMDRRRSEREDSGREYMPLAHKIPAPRPVRLWQHLVHVPGTYDLEVDTSTMDAEACAMTILRHLDETLAGPSAFERLAGPVLR